MNKTITEATHLIQHLYLSQSNATNTRPIKDRTKHYIPPMARNRSVWCHFADVTEPYSQWAGGANDSMV